MPQDNQEQVVAFVEGASARQAAAQAARASTGGATAAAAVGASTAENPMAMPENWRARCRSTTPLDFSFSEVSCMQDLSEKKPVEREPPSSRRPGSRSSRSRPPSRNGVAGLRDSQYSCDIEAVTSLRLNNNRLLDVEGLLPCIMPRLEPFHVASQLLWLDLSFNGLTDVEEALLEFTHLRVLYLHANQIQETARFDRLAKLTHLTNLAIHGNPLDAVVNIEKKLLSAMPNLSKLNFSPVTRLQRADADQWAASVARSRAKANAK
jgi:hypothetical protein